MFADQCRAAIVRAPIPALDDLSRALWQANGAGAVSDADAQDLAELIQARRTLAKAGIAAPGGCPPRERSYFPPKRPVPVYDRREARYRRRAHARSRWMPDDLASRFTDGELAALAVIAQEHITHGRCTLPMGKIAALAGVSESTARNAFREARRLDLIAVQERPRARAPHLPNIVTIADAAWCKWLERRPASRPMGGGCNVLKATPLSGKNPPLIPHGSGQRHPRRGIRGMRASPAAPVAPHPGPA